MDLSKCIILTGFLFIFSVALTPSLSFAEVPGVAKEINSIITSDKWDSPGKLGELVNFPLVVTDREYLSGNCNSKCSRFQFKDYQSSKKVFEHLHNSWNVSPPAAEDDYFLSPFAEIQKYDESNHRVYGVVVTGDCSHVDEVILNKSLSKVESINVDGASLNEDESLKTYLLGVCEQ